MGKVNVKKFTFSSTPSTSTALEVKMQCELVSARARTSRKVEAA